MYTGIGGLLSSKLSFVRLQAISVDPIAVYAYTAWLGSLCLFVFSLVISSSDLAITTIVIVVVTLERCEIEIDAKCGCYK